MALQRSRARRARPGSGRCTARWTAWWSSPTRWPTTRSATRRPAAVGLPAAGRRARPPEAAAARLRDPGLHRPGRHVGRTARRSSRRSSSAWTRCSPRGDCPDAIVVFVDAWTSYGGSQFLNSTGTGRYLDYLCDEVVPFVDERYPTSPSRDHRGLTGKSSGGYGAMVVPMLRPDVFGALASHAGDALFECCYLPEFPDAARKLRDGSTAPTRSSSSGCARPTTSLGAVREPLELYGYAAAYSPDPSAPARRCSRSTSRPAGCSTTCGRSGSTRTRCGWRRSTPTRCARCAASTSTPAARTSTSSTSGRRRSRRSWSELGVEHTLELFDGKHGGLDLPLSGRDPGARARANVGTRGRPHARRDRRQLPADLGADQARARAPGARRDARGRGAARARRSRTCRGRPPRPATRSRSTGTSVRIVRR